MSKSARKCRACGAQTVLVRRTTITRVGRVRALLCYTCGDVSRTVEVDAATMVDVLAGDADLIADLFRATCMVQVEMER